MSITLQHSDIGTTRSDVIASPWSKETPTKAGEYWIRNHRLKGSSGKLHATPCIVYLYNNQVLFAGSKELGYFHVDEIEAEWAKAEPPK